MNSQLVCLFSAMSKSMELHIFLSVQNLAPVFSILFPHVYLLTNLELLHLWKSVRTSKTDLEIYNIISFFWKQKACSHNVNLTRLLIIYISCLNGGLHFIYFYLLVIYFLFLSSLHYKLIWHWKIWQTHRVATMV